MRVDKIAADTDAPLRLTVWRRWLWALTVAAAIAAASLAGFTLGALHRTPGAAELPIIRPAPTYTLTNQLGQRVSSTSFLGKVQLVTFLDPYCTQLCPLTTANLVNFENLAARPAGIADRIQIVAFNLDPKNAGPPQMRAFLKEYGWNPDDRHWQYLTGLPAAVRHVVRDGFSVAYEATPLSSETGSGEATVVEPEIVNKLAEQAHRGYDIAHQDVIEVVDRRGQVRKIFEDARTVSSAELLKIVDALLGDEGAR